MHLREDVFCPEQKNTGTEKKIVNNLFFNEIFYSNIKIAYKILLLENNL
jgi:hypothetical protein